MLKIAYFSPLPPAPTGIADYSRDLLPALSEEAALTLFVEKPSQVSDGIQERYQVESIAAYPEKRWHFDLALYHMGNSGVYHAAIYDTALRYPGVVVLHEVILHDFAALVSIGRGDFAAFAREIGYELGSAGYELAWKNRLGHRSPAIRSVSFSRRLIERSLGIVVHSQSAAELVYEQCTSRPTVVIAQLVARRKTESMRQRLGVSDETAIFATTGLVNANKQIDLTLDAFAELKQVEPDVYFLVVGAAYTDVNLPRLIRQRGLQNSVYWTGRVDTLEEFAGWTAAADVVISLRHPFLGETSNAAVRAMAAGRPLIVYDQGWYGELPADVCLKVPPMDPGALTQAMLFLARHPGERQALGQAAALYAREHLDPRRIAGQYARFIAEVLETSLTATGNPV